MSRKDRETEFWTYVQQRSGRLRLIARTICPDRELADDLVQEALERTWLSWRKLDDPDPFAWTRRVLVDLNIDRLRRRHYSEQTLDGVDRQQQIDRPGQIDDQLWIAEILDGLTMKERAVIVLRFLEDLSEAETADQLGIARGTVKSTCARALEMIRRQPAVTQTQTAGALQ